MYSSFRVADLVISDRVNTEIDIHQLFSVKIVVRTGYFQTENKSFHVRIDIYLTTQEYFWPHLWNNMQACHYLIWPGHVQTGFLSNT